MCVGKTIKKTSSIDNDDYEIYVITFTDGSKLSIKSQGYYGEQSDLDIEYNEE